MIHALVQGALIADAVPRTTRKVAPFVTATIRVLAGEGEVYVGLVVFDPTACERLAALKAGAGVCAGGELQSNNWTSKDGQARTGWRMVANEILSIAQAQRKRRKDAEADEPEEAGSLNDNHRNRRSADRRNPAR